MTDVPELHESNVGFDRVAAEYASMPASGFAATPFMGSLRRMDRAFGTIGSSLMELNIINSDQARILNYINTTSTAILGVFALYRGIEALIRAKQAIDTTAATVETAAHLAAQDYVGVAVAAGAGLAAFGALEAAQTYIMSHDMNTPQGIREVGYVMGG